jgi:hypothetical protein
MPDGYSGRKKGNSCPWPGNRFLPAGPDDGEKTWGLKKYLPELKLPGKEGL